jgi:hypothetical protein
MMSRPETRLAGHGRPVRNDAGDPLLSHEPTIELVARARGGDMPASVRSHVAPCGDRLSVPPTADAARMAVNRAVKRLSLDFAALRVSVLRVRSCLQER